MDLRIPWKTGNLLTDRVTLSFSRRTLLHGVLDLLIFIIMITKASSDLESAVPVQFTFVPSSCTLYGLLRKSNAPTNFSVDRMQYISSELFQNVRGWNMRTDRQISQLCVLCKELVNRKVICTSIYSHGKCWSGSEIVLRKVSQPVGCNWGPTKLWPCEVEDDANGQKLWPWETGELDPVLPAVVMHGQADYTL